MIIWVCEQRGCCKAVESFDVGLSHCRGWFQVSVCSVRFCMVSVACNEVAVVVLIENVMFVF